ncbi:prolipoprotein diacylglyceryl transferase [soil metagenome]
MQFPVYFHVFGYSLHPHVVMELLAYTLGFQFYLLLRRRQIQPTVPIEKNLWIIVGAIFGALVGSKILAWLESPQEYAAVIGTPAMLGGKTIVGGLLGGWAGVEIAKKRLGVTQSTGDLFVFPLAMGICIGRIGCFLTGLPDHTDGNLTNVPWAVDFGDGPRHPTQLYEIAFIAILAILLAIRYKLVYTNGRTFRLFLSGYLLFRVAVEFLKPSYKPYLGVSMIQIASLIGAIVALRLWKPRSNEAS